MSRLTVDLDALAANHATLRRQAGASEVAPVVKANGYGLGAGEVARRLAAEGAATFFVARLGEGLALRRDLGLSPAIYVLDGCTRADAASFVPAGLSPVLNSLDQVAAWQGAGGGAAALMIDTGLNRLGVTPDEARALAASSDRLRNVELNLVMSHLACADRPDHPMNAAQRARFVEAAAAFPGVRRSLAASDGLFLGADYAFDLVRTGVCLYGGGPEGRPDPRIRPVATLEAPILQIRTVATGETVGYGASFRAERPMRAAIVGAGYADGVLRAAGGRAYGSLAGRRCPAIGRISMDLMVFDVTEHPDARAGDLMQLIGPHVPVDEAAAAANSIAYELLVRVGARSERRYVSACGGATA